MKDEKKVNGAVDDLLRNNGFVNPMPFPMLCEKSGALHLAEPGLTAGRWQVAGRRKCW